MPEYTKPFLTISQQIDLLTSRGMEIHDRAKAEHYLKQIGYYRLSAYWHISRAQDANGNLSDNYIDNTTFQDSLNLYVFDRKLRLLFLDALGRIENTLKTTIALRLGAISKCSYLEPTVFDGNFSRRKPKFKIQRKYPQTFGKLLSNYNKPSDYDKWLKSHMKCLERAESGEKYVKVFREKYGKSDLPIWMMVNIWDLGTTSTLLAGMKQQDRNAVAAVFGIENKGNIIVSWLRCLSFARNVSAHHGRLWNRTMISQPGLPKSGTYSSLDMVRANPGIEHLLYPVAAVTQILMLQVSPNSQWKNRLRDTIQNSPTMSNGIDLNPMMGFPSGWEQDQIWT